MSIDGILRRALARSLLLGALAAALGAVFLVVGVLFMSLWSAALVVFVIGSITAELFGFLGILGLKLSAVPAVILILSVGVGVEFTIHLLTVSRRLDVRANVYFQKLIPVSIQTIRIFVLSCQTLTNLMESFSIL